MADPLENRSNVAIRPYGSNGWKMWEAMPAGVKPRYRWQRSWIDEMPVDIIGFDGKRPIGRVFQIEEIVDREIWFWVLYGVEEQKRKRPGKGSGWEKSMQMAACRVEWCYNRLKQDD